MIFDKNHIEELKTYMLCGKRYTLSICKLSHHAFLLLKVTTQSY